MTTLPTDIRILDAAQHLMQVRGYNAFSYADIADVVGIRKASIHHHFATKADLARAVVVRYRAETRAMIAAIDHKMGAPTQKLRDYVGLYATMLHNGPRICLCALLAAETPTLPDIVGEEIQGFFTDHESWLTSVFVAAGDTPRRPEGAPRSAQVLLAGIDGAMLIARTYHDAARFDAVAEGLLDLLLEAD